MLPFICLAIFSIAFNRLSLALGPILPNHGTYAGVNGSSTNETSYSGIRLNETVPFAFRGAGFMFHGEYEPAITLSDTYYRNVPAILGLTSETYKLFYPGSDTDTIPLGTHLVFYYRNYEVSASWGGELEPGKTAWQRSGMINVPNYLANWLDRQPHDVKRHPLKSFITAEENFGGVMTVEVQEAGPSPTVIPAGSFTFKGELYEADSLPADDCRAVFQQAMQWLRRFKQKSRIPGSTAKAFTSNNMSLRLVIGGRMVTRAEAITYAELGQALNAYSNYIQGSRTGCTVAAFGLSKGVKQAGFFDLTKSYIPQAALTAQ